MVPSVIAASAVQINVMVNSSFASFVGKEAVSWLNFAFRLMQLPIGVFGVAVATITLPVVSRIAAHSDRSEFGPTLGKAMRLAVFLTLPSAVGLFFLAQPIIGIIYERGEFKHHDTVQTGLALQFYSVGLVFYSCIKVLSPAFYAIDKKWTPMFVSFAAIGLNFCLNYFFIFQFGLGHRGLALATSTIGGGKFSDTLFTDASQCADARDGTLPRLHCALRSGFGRSGTRLLAGREPWRLVAGRPEPLVEGRGIVRDDSCAPGASISSFASCCGSRK